MIHKVGPHIEHTTAAARLWAKVAPILKCCNFPELLDEAPESAIRIFRATEENEPEKDQLTPQQWFDRTVSRAAGRRAIMESMNEWRSHISEGYLSRIPWDIQFVELCHQHGLQAAGPNWPFGAYDEAEVRALRDNNFCDFDYISLHEYGPAEGDGWTTLRYRKFHEWAGPDHPPILITEAGLVDATDASWPKTYDAAIQQDDYVKGAVIFGAGPFDYWIDRGYNYDAVVDQILPEYVSDGGNMPESFGWKLAFATYAAAHPEIGGAVTDLMYDHLGNAWQYGEHGLLFSHKADDWKIYQFLSSPKV